ncbi:MAG TPA: endolytic transglycosylase MltG [Candidatus Paceibacterota bacterium]|nr:endolytic transglycosylase MltG [Candidatus Paceibacterota bacterium]
MEISNFQDTQIQKPLLSKKKGAFVIIILILLWLIYTLFIGSFSVFETPKQIVISRGESLRQIARNLDEKGIVGSSSLLSTMVILLDGESNIVSGVYSFEKKAGVYDVAKRIMEGKTNIKASKITFPEGFTSAQIAKRIYDLFPTFNSEEFLAIAKEKEGYLFPDTYFLLPDIAPSELVARLEDTFWMRVEEKFGWKKEESEKTYDTLILASILEEEVRGLSDKKMVADIFQRRMKIGMPLQADSTLAYITGRDSLSLTVDDLKSDSPYNSYTKKGLPPTPISNPGLESIEAALNPEPNKYLYFLTDEDGKVYYAKTFDEHKQNKFKYLK